MKQNRLWIEIAALSIAIAFALALLIATLGAAVEMGPQTDSDSESKATPAERTFEGMITDTRCGARHEAALGRSASNCVRICLHQGERFALLDGDKTYVLDGDMNALKRIAGQRARVVGVAQGSTIKVSSISPAA